MLRSSATRFVAAQSQRRAASTSTDAAAAKAKAAAGAASAQAGQLYNKASGALGNALGAYKEPILENAAVARELVKQVYVAEKLSPPSLTDVRYAYGNFYQSAQSANFWQELYKSGQWKKVAIYAVEAYGIFKIGEMIGRRHVVGYKLEENRYAKLT